MAAGIIGLVSHGLNYSCNDLEKIAWKNKLDES